MANVLDYVQTVQTLPTVVHVRRPAKAEKQIQHNTPSQSCLLLSIQFLSFRFFVSSLSCSCSCSSLSHLLLAFHFVFFIPPLLFILSVSSPFLIGRTCILFFLFFFSSSHLALLSFLLAFTDPGGLEVCGHGSRSSLSLGLRCCLYNWNGGYLFASTFYIRQFYAN